MAAQTVSSTCLDDGTITIGCGGRLTIENVADFAASIRTALARSHRVTVEFEPLVEVDISILQVLCAACKTAVAEGKALSHQGAGSESLRQLIVAAGADCLGSCRYNNKRPCLWLGGRHS